ncbi:MAG: DUF3618 domain-containing protein, partial [Pseudonocardiaceae bacterium]
MSPETAQLEAEIAQERQELAVTLRALGDKVAPKKVVVRTRAAVGEKVADKKDEIRDRVSPTRVLKRKADSVRGSVREMMTDAPTPSLPSAGGSKATSRRALDVGATKVESVKGRAREMSQKVENRMDEASLDIR